MGAVAGLLAMPTGLTLALILIYIINRRSFGWTLQLQPRAGPLPAGAGAGRDRGAAGGHLPGAAHGPDADRGGAAR